MVWGLDADPLDPRVRVYDADRRPGRLPGAGQRRRADERAGPRTPTPAEYSRPGSGPGQPAPTGGYFLAADFNQFTPTSSTGRRPDTLDPGGGRHPDALAVAGRGVPVRGWPPDLLRRPAAGGVTMTVTDAAGRTWWRSPSAAAGSRRRRPPGTWPAGAYTVRYTYRPAGAGTTAATVRYGLFLLQMSDGVGPYATDTSSSHGPPSGGSSGSSGSGGDTGYTYSGSSSSHPDGYGYYF